jgi:hypothetical protein
VPNNVRVVKGTVVVEDTFSEAELGQLVGRHRSRTAFELRRTRHTSLAFLTDLPAIESLSLVSVKVGDARALSQVGTLRTLFLNGITAGAGWDFLADLVQIHHLHILNTRGELALPDLSGLARLTSFRAWGCRGLDDVSILSGAPRLEEVELVDTGLTPEQLVPLLEKPSVRYLSSSFRRRQDAELFQQYLDRAGKKAHREAT